MNYFVSVLVLLINSITTSQADLYRPLPPQIEETVYIEEPQRVVVDYEQIDFYKDEIYCLALNAYFEARNSVWDDMVATSHVVINRARSQRYPQTICNVIEQPYQFSWMNSGKNVEPILSNPIEAAAWRRAMLAAMATYSGYVDDTTRGATHYHAYYVEPYWTDRNDRVRIGKHYYMRVA